MRGLTIGQVFVLHYGLAHFLKRTNPLGGGASGGAPEPAATDDVATTMFEADRVGLLKGKGIVHISTLEPSLQDILRAPQLERKRR